MMVTSRQRNRKVNSSIHFIMLHKPHGKMCTIAIYFVLQRKREQETRMSYTGALLCFLNSCRLERIVKHGKGKQTSSTYLGYNKASIDFVQLLMAV